MFSRRRMGASTRNRRPRRNAPSSGRRQDFLSPFLRTDRLKEAEAAYDEALRAYPALGDRLGEANVRQALGDLYVRTLRLEQGELAYKEALSAHRAIGDRMGEGNTLKALGTLYVLTQRLEDAEQVQSEALAISRSIESLGGQADALQGLGHLALARGDALMAFSRFAEARELALRAVFMVPAAMNTALLAQAASAAGHPARAVVLAGRALADLRRLESQTGQWVAFLTLAMALAALGNEPLASTAFILAWATAAAVADPQAGPLAAALQEADPDFDPSTPPSPEQLEAYERALAPILAECEAQLAAEGIDPYSPLPPP